MTRSLLAFTAGCAFLFSFSHLLSQTNCKIFYVSLLLLIFIGVWFKKNKVLCYLIFFLVGLAWANFMAEENLVQRLPDTLINQTIPIVGKIISLPATQRAKNEKNNITRFDFLVQTLNNKRLSLPIRLVWYGQHPELLLGDKWSLFVRLRPPNGLRNPGGFDYQRELFIENIRALGYVTAQKPYQLIHRSSHYFSIQHFRQIIFSHIQSSVANPDLASILCALTIGFKGLMTPIQLQTFQRTGTYHLVVIAGLHIGFVSELVFWLVRHIWSYFPGAMLRCAAQPIAAMAGLLTAVGYSFLGGFSIPTQRAVVMIVLMLWGNFVNRHIVLWRRLLLAAFWVLLLAPLSIVTASFWLSFSAVASITYGLQGRLQSLPKLGGWFWLQWLLFLGLLPIMLYFFQQFSLVAFIANSIAIPWVGMIIVPICLLASGALMVNQTLGHHLFLWAAKLLAPLYSGLQWLAKGSWVVWQHSMTGLFILLAGTVGALLLLAPSGFKIKWLGLAWILPIFYFKPDYLQPGEIRLTILDVGQGLSAVVRTAHHNLLFDAGPKSYGGFDAGAWVVVPYLQFLNLKHLNLMMISHGDSDHIGGASAVLTHFKIDHILTSVPDKFTSANACFASQSWEWDGVEFKVLAPPQNEAYLGNNSSCVLHIKSPGGAILLTGDIEHLRENWLLTHFVSELAATILVAPHHGSKTSSSEPFIEAVNPQYVIFPAGAHNRFHFPASVVVAAYKARAIKTFCTGEKGAISLTLSPQGTVSITTMADKSHYWEH